VTVADSSNSPVAARKVLLIGWDAADWGVIAPLLDAGQMPYLESLVNRGVMGNLATLYPILSPMLWTSIATGKRAWKHGIHGFSEPDATSGGMRPVSSLSRRCKAVWNILNQNGYQSNIIGWWPSNPAEPINGVMISDLFKQPNRSPDKPWPLPAGSVHPPELREHIARLRVHPFEVEGDLLLPFVPRAAEIDQTRDKRLVSIARCLAECTTIHAAATAVMQLEPWDFMAVYYDAIDHFCHGFMRYHPPRLDWVPEADFELYKEVVAAAYRFHDMMLGTLLQLAGEETTVILISDHGFHSDQLRPRAIPNEPAGPAEEHRQHGIIVMAGPGIKQDDLIFGANLLDITPTILNLFGLPVARDMDGSPIVGAFKSPPRVEMIDSWEEIPGQDGRHPENFQPAPVDSHEAMQRLVDLGYIERPDESREVAVAKTIRELRYNLARAYQGANRIPEAQRILDDLWQRWPNEHRFGLRMFHNCLQLRQTQRAGEILQTLRARKRETVARAREELRKLEEQWEGEKKKAEDADEQERHRINQLRKQANTNEATFTMMEASLLQAEGKPRRALELFETIRQVESHYRTDVLKKLGDVLLGLRRWWKAEAEFRAMLDLDPMNPEARLGIARSLLPQRRYEEALAEATAAVSLRFHFPQAHFFVGSACMRLGLFDQAASALQTAVSQNPVYPEAHRRLARLYAGPLDRPDLAKKHREYAELAQQRLVDFYAGRTLPERHQVSWDASNESSPSSLGQFDGRGAEPLSPNTIVVVSGLPRSGTSMMMQMLAAGGLPVLADDHRPADESNPRGYQEYEPAKHLATDSSWLKDGCGKAVKIIAQLLPHLPRDYNYRILFMERPFCEVVASQEKLLQRLGRTGRQSPADNLARTFQQQIQGVRKILERYPEQISIKSIGYSDTLNAPENVARTVNRFLGGQLDERAMAASVDSSLRHEIS